MADSQPSFVGKFLALSDENRKTVLSRTHPKYKARINSWSVLLDAFEGEGGFLDGSYLWPYPREEQFQFEERKKQARYHNYLEALVDLYTRMMFTSGVHRSSKNEDFNAWLMDVDGANTPINDFMKRLSSVALVCGHSGALVDKTPDEPTGPTRADEQARVVASVFTAPAITDWRFSYNVLEEVKLLEDAKSYTLLAEPSTYTCQYLIWTDEGWARFSEDGTLISSAVLDLGLVPLIVLRPKPSQLSDMLGRGLISNANVIRASFNRSSEEDEVLRSQAFSLLTVSVSDNGDVDKVKNSLGTVGTAKAVVAQGTIDYKTPDQMVPEAIRNNVRYLTEEQYRMAHVRYRQASAMSETADSIRLQFTELNEMLIGFSRGLADAEKRIARAWFAWSYPTVEQATTEFEKAEVETQYPDEFFLNDLEAELETWQRGMEMDLGPTMGKRIRKKAVRRIDPDIPADELTQIDSEIDALPDDIAARPMPPGTPDMGLPVETVEAQAAAQSAQTDTQSNGEQPNGQTTPQQGG